jgi:hypothetical protein
MPVLLQLFLLHLPRHAVLYSADLQLPKDRFVQQLLQQPRLLHLQPSQLQLQAASRLRPLPPPVPLQQLLS